MIPYCGECKYFKYEDTDGYGVCGVDGKERRCSDACLLESLTPRQVTKVLHDFQKWRRGGKDKMIPPYVIGEVIDAAIRSLRQIAKEDENLSFSTPFVNKETSPF